MNDIDELKAELERVQKQAAAMREALELVIENPVIDLMSVIRRALAQDAGANYVRKEDVKPLAETIEFLLGECDRRSWENSTDEWCPVPKALAIIRALDL